MLRNTQTYNDGVVEIYSVKNSAAPPNRPVPALDAVAETLRYRERTVGVTRYYAAAQTQVKVDRLLRVPWRETVSTQHVAVIGGVQYKIIQVQRPEEIFPPAMDLSLERLVPAYDIG